MFLFKKTSVILLLILLCIPLISAQIIDPVRWTYESKKISDTEFLLMFKAKIAEGWHMYGRNIPDNGPIPTSFSFDENNSISLSGTIKDETKPLVKYDSTFSMNLELFSNYAEFSQRIIITKKSQVKIVGNIEYMTCDDQRCLPPKEVEFTFAVDGTVITNKPDQQDQGDTVKKQSLSISISDTAVQKNDSSIVISQDSSSATLMQNNELTSTKSAKKSLWGIFILSLLGGLAGLLTPCVYPIIPLTVGYFMREKKRAALKGLFFGISIIFIYTLIGLLAGLTGLDFSRLTSNWISNLIFFAIFIALAISFLGVFEIMLPTSLANKVDQQVDKGGLLGPFFMALATVIISFSCTGPIVGVLLGNALHGNVIVPVVGMFGFALSFAAPFTVLAMFPGFLKSMPKSGSWMNAIKVVFAFILFAFSIKFLSNIDQSYHLNLISRPFFISIWIVLFFLLGLYLLGKIKFSHDSETNHLSVTRFLFATASFIFALYLFFGLFGASLKKLDPILPPPSDNDFSLIFNKNDKQDNFQAQTSNICSTPKYIDLFHLPYGLQGYFDYQEGLACAKQLDKPILLDFKGHYCSNCKVMESTVWSDENVLKMLREDFIIIALYTDDKTTLPAKEWYTSKIDGRIKKTIGAQNLDFQIGKFNTNSIPFYAIISPEEKLLTQPIGLTSEIDVYINFLDKGTTSLKQ